MNWKKFNNWLNIAMLIMNSKWKNKKQDSIKEDLKQTE